MMCNDLFAFCPLAQRLGGGVFSTCDTYVARRGLRHMDFQVSQKGAVSIYGLNRFPFTLYAEEWKAVFGARRMILRFVATHHLQLSCRCTNETRQAFRDALACGDLGSDTRVGSLWCKKAKTAAVSLYGLRRFPITLYCDQWFRVFEARNEIESFIKENTRRLETKGCSVPRPKQSSDTRPFRETVGPDNIIRPIAARSSELR